MSLKQILGAGPRGGAVRRHIRGLLGVTVAPAAVLSELVESVAVD